MRFLHIDPKAKTVKPAEGADPHIIPALAKVNVDHNVVIKFSRHGWGGIGIFVYEYGLMEGDGPYFELLGVLYSGDAVLYRFDDAGETVDMPEKEDSLIKPRWFANKEEVELGIAAGVVERPVNTVNGAVIWRWS